jgi:hypothetical protein
MRRDSLGSHLDDENRAGEQTADCEAAALWLVELAESEFGTKRLMIGGESAGAHLAAVTLIRLRDRHGLQPFVGANLVYGAFDLRITASAWNWGDRLLVLNTPIIEFFSTTSFPKNIGPTPMCPRSSPTSLVCPCVVHRWNGRSPARRLALHVRPLGSGGQPGRARPISRWRARIRCVSNLTGWGTALDRMYDFLNRC